VNSKQTIIDSWTFGGGTAMMLQIGHRESHDVDIFLPDRQLLPFLDPKTHNFNFEIKPAEYSGDASGFLKLAFEGVGEVDFIVGHAMTPSPTTQRVIEDETVQLETIPEIIIKKIYHRGPNIQSRDIFDIAAAGEQHADSIIEELRSYPEKVASTLARIEKLNPEFVNNAIAELAIKDSYRSVAKNALERTKDILRSV
jgi:hypothetical protein